ncbi:NAD(P)(+) transhydrogenase (Re/Si-specific) subunit beta, partial [Escherichia coli]|uniref:NAD(P)(+) transhydrogenase (Re/Si-specific) subunit beta n=2 Tax=Gammaproteobacteria TaxID=1236 RepID=UPI0028DF9BA2
VALALGTGLAWVSAKKVAITDMPQMVALYNGMGGGSAAAIGAVELLRFADVAGRDTSHWSAEAIAALAARQPSATVL